PSTAASRNRRPDDSRRDPRTEAGPPGNRSRAREPRGREIPALVAQKQRLYPRTGFLSPGRIRPGVPRPIAAARPALHYAASLPSLPRLSGDRAKAAGETGAEEVKGDSVRLPRGLDGNPPPSDR